MLKVFFKVVHLENEKSGLKSFLREATDFIMHRHILTFNLQFTL